MDGGHAGIHFSLLWTKLIRSFDDVYGRPTARRIRSLDDSILDEGGAPRRNGTTREHGGVRGLKPREEASISLRRHRPIALTPAISIFPPSFEISLNFFLPARVHGD
jgi:hypothetical protein